MVVSRPWPGSTRVSAGSVNRRRSIDSMICSKLPPGKRGVAGAAGEQGVAAEDDRVPLEQERGGAGRVARVVDGAELDLADGDDVVVGDHEVVGGQHVGVLARDPHVDAGVAHRGDGLDVVPVPVRGEHPPDAGGPAHLEEQLVLVGRVDDDGLAGALAADDEHVVLDRADDELLDPDGGGLVVRRSRHAPRVRAAFSECARRVAGRRAFR